MTKARKKQANKWTGPKIKSLREYTGLTQERFGALLKCSSRHYMSTLEKNGVNNGTTKAELLDMVESVKEKIKKSIKEDNKLYPLQYYVVGFEVI